MELSPVILHGLIGSAALTANLLLISLTNPRIMLEDYPPAIRVAVAPKTQREIRQMWWFSITYMAIFIGYPSVMAYQMLVELNWAFAHTFSFVWLVLLFFNLYDLLILDWLVFCTWTPKFIVIPGTAGNPGYKDYRFHFKGFLKGITITAAIALGISGAITLFA